MPDLFATNALALGDISTEKDSDGVLRRVKAFRIYRHWHPLFKKAADDYGLDLADAKFAPGKIILPQTGTTNTVEVPVDAENNFSLADFVGDKLPPGVAPKAKAFTDERVWQMGIVLAAQELKLDLQNAEIDLPRGKIILRGANGIERTIPVDADGYFFIDWRLKPNDPHLLQAPIESLLLQDNQRLSGETNGLADAFRGKLVVVGSTAQGNDLSDRGATPLDKDTFLVSKYWNVANSDHHRPFRPPRVAAAGTRADHFFWRAHGVSDVAVARVHGAGRDISARDALHRRRVFCVREIPLLAAACFPARRRDAGGTFDARRLSRRV